MATPGSCEHLSALASVRSATAYQCDQCVVTGDSWVHLRTCQECGSTLCCDNSMNRHATRHAQVSGHPVVASAEPGERWLYCYPDRIYGGY
jgi:3-deoxy-D-manno-octulosonate 8-phosphate phosphatase KdsC-like HAD superfamily phosphatase